MKFKNKLLILISGVVFCSVVLTTLSLDEAAENIIFIQSKAKALSIASSVAVLIDGDIHQHIISQSDEKSAAFLAMRQSLLKARDANRREDTYVKQIYTVYPDPTNNKMLLIGVNPALDDEFRSHVGDVLHIKEEQIPEISKPNAPDYYFEDQWGSWSAAFSPILNHAGKVVGAVVVEIPKDRVINRIGLLHRKALLAFGAGLALALLGALFIARMASKPLHALKKGLEGIKSGDFSARIALKSKDEFAEVAQTFNNMAEGLQEGETLKSAFARYVSQQVLDTVISSGLAPVVSGDRRKVTALFADIRGFTTLSESLPPEVVVKVLNEYFEIMVDIIFKHKGTLDKFIGDGIMVIFGAPVEDHYQEEHAIRAALEMQKALTELRKTWSEKGGIDIKIGIGINSGNAIVGNIGSSRRMEYTAIGDSVNLASRLEAATKDHGVDILISDYTYHAVRGMFQTSKVGEIKVKGRIDPVLTYTVSES